jgi:hypothetical protein
VVVVATDELFGQDGTQALQADPPLSDPLGGLVTGSAYAAGGNSAQEQAEVAATRVDVPAAPAAPDQAPLKLAVDKAMMTGPPTNPLRLPTMTAHGFASPQPVHQPPPQRQALRVPPGDQEERILREARASLAGRQSLRRSHPFVSGVLRVIVPVAFIVLLLILALRGSGSGGNLRPLRIARFRWRNPPSPCTLSPSPSVIRQTSTSHRT